MWLRLGNEYLNLDHIVRVKFNKGWKHGQEELVAEVEGLIKGEIQVITRYRGPEAEFLQTMLRPRTDGVDQHAGSMAGTLADASSRALSATLHDVKLP